MTYTTLEPLFPEVWLHERPRVTDRKGNPTWRVPRSNALSYPYIEPNVTGKLQSLIITDRDSPDADRIAGALGLPTPSWIALNPHTTTGHIVYALKDPVPLTNAARRPPVNFLARIEHGLADVLDGDPGYSGNLTKNPHHAMHPTLWGEETARYGLRELARALDELGALPNAGSPRKHVTRSAVGRNVSLFDDTRQWAYKAVRSFWGAPTGEWDSAVLAKAYEWNETRIANDFTTGPLPAVEVGYLAKSVASWIWQRFTPEEYARKFSQIQAAKARRKQLETMRLIKEATRG